MHKLWGILSICIQHVSLAPGPKDLCQCGSIPVPRSWIWLGGSCQWLIVFEWWLMDNGWYSWWHSYVCDISKWNIYKSILLSNKTEIWYLAYTLNHTKTVTCCIYLSYTPIICMECIIIHPWLHVHHIITKSIRKFLWWSIVSAKSSKLWGQVWHRCFDTTPGWWALFHVFTICI